MPTPFGTVIKAASSPAGRRALRYAARVARTEEGRKLIAQAGKVARSPEARKLISQVKAVVKQPDRDPAGGRAADALRGGSRVRNGALKDARMVGE